MLLSKQIKDDFGNENEEFQRKIQEIKETNIFYNCILIHSSLILRIKCWYCSEKHAAINKKEQSTFVCVFHTNAFVCIFHTFLNCSSDSTDSADGIADDRPIVPMVTADSASSNSDSTDGNIDSTDGPIIKNFLGAKFGNIGTIGTIDTIEIEQYRW